MVPIDFSLKPFQFPNNVVSLNLLFLELLIFCINILHRFCFGWFRVLKWCLFSCRKCFNWLNSTLFSSEGLDAMDYGHVHGTSIDTVRTMTLENTGRTLVGAQLKKVRKERKFY
ncbi:hypothetical protein CsSME_00028896 [Camellia sinensis var. sinensis]